MNNMITAIKAFSVHNINSCGFELLQQKQIDRKYLIRKIDRHLRVEMFAISNNKVKFPKNRKLSVLQI